ncbi:MAG TPA: penicillin-binding transpeptidase domain-containing protein [Acidimicrobiales bacterium]|nr:penicillin-binding transpeptidase domain-containing protein [Acidimicrobiales bacterium]
MSRRLSTLAAVILLLFVVVAAQSANLQFFRAKALDNSPLNPRNSQASNNAPRGQIVAADGTILAESVRTGSVYRRVYPLGALTSGLIGFSSPIYGTWALEAEYNNYLISHAQPPQSLAQVLAPTSAADNVTLTLEPALQRIAQRAMAGRDGAAVVLNPQNGNILAMYSNPTYNPIPLTSPDYAVAKAAWTKDNTNDAEGFPPLGLVATQQTFPPGSTFKIVTTSAVVVSKPQLLLKYYRKAVTINLPNTNKTFSNYAFGSCGGTIAEMLPPSCDTGFAMVGLDVGGTDLSLAADSFGYNEVPPIDLPGAVASNFPPASFFTFNLPGVAYSAIGQQDVRTSALQNALVAAAVGHHGVMMTPHLLNYVTGPDGTIVKRYKPTVWKNPLTAAQAGQIVPLMVNVALYGTAYGVFPAADNVAAKTGTSQVGNSSQNTDDWMIAFAPASDPTIAVAVVLPFQVTSATGASVAGPVMRCLVEGALAIQSGQRFSMTGSTCP